MWVARRSAVTIVAKGWVRAIERAASRSSTANVSTMCMPPRIPGPRARQPRPRSSSFGALRCGNSRSMATRRDPTVRALHRAAPRPFEQLRYEDLPERPRVPHRYDDADPDDFVVASKPFGRLRVRVVSYGPPAPRRCCSSTAS